MAQVTPDRQAYKNVKQLAHRMVARCVTEQFGLQSLGNPFGTNDSSRWKCDEEAGRVGLRVDWVRAEEVAQRVKAAGGSPKKNWEQCMGCLSPEGARPAVPAAPVPSVQGGMMGDGDAGMMGYGDVGMMGNGAAWMMEGGDQGMFGAGQPVVQHQGGGMPAGEGFGERNPLADMDPRLLPDVGVWEEEEPAQVDPRSVVDDSAAGEEWWREEMEKEFRRQEARAALEEFRWQEARAALEEFRKQRPGGEVTEEEFKWQLGKMGPEEKAAFEAEWVSERVREQRGLEPAALGFVEGGSAVGGDVVLPGTAFAEESVAEENVAVDPVDWDGTVDLDGMSRDGLLF